MYHKCPECGRVFGRRWRYATCPKCHVELVDMTFEDYQKYWDKVTGL